MQGGVALDKFDALGALIDWVEKGKAPDRIIASVDPANKEIPRLLEPETAPARSAPGRDTRNMRAAIRRGVVVRLREPLRIHSRASTSRTRSMSSASGTRELGALAQLQIIGAVLGRLGEFGAELHVADRHLRAARRVALVCALDHGARGSCADPHI